MICSHLLVVFSADAENIQDFAVLTRDVLQEMQEAHGVVLVAEYFNTHQQMPRTRATLSVMQTLMAHRAGHQVPGSGEGPRQGH